ncbi:unnamed protein product, partial [Allacma fusca]
MVFGLIYGAILTVASAYYCFQLERAYDETLCPHRTVMVTDIRVSSGADPTATITSPTTPMELSPEEFLGILCDRYTKWHSCAIVGIFVGTLVLVYSMWSLNSRKKWFPGYHNSDNSCMDKKGYLILFRCFVA